MKYLYLLLLLPLTLLCTSCADQQGTKTIAKKNLYELTLPSFLSETSNLNEDASLEYQHLFKEFYVVVIDEPKDEFHQVLIDYDLTETYTSDLEGYTNLILDDMKTALTNPTISEVSEANVNGLPARFVTVDSKIEGIQIYYAYGMYEGQDNYYQVIAWTLSEKQDTHKAKMQDILESLNELSKGSKKKMME